MTESERQAIRRRTAELIRQSSPDVAGRIKIVCALTEEFEIGDASALEWWKATKKRLTKTDITSRPATGTFSTSFHAGRKG